MSVRRDAVASILLNLYVLAGALRSKRPVPRYLPSAAVARKRLLDRMAEIEAEHEIERQVRPRPEKSRRWADVYREYRVGGRQRQPANLYEIMHIRQR